MNKITEEEYNKAYEIVSRYEYQQKPKTIEVSVTYNATVSVTINVPGNWNIEKIKKELKNDYYYFDKEDEEDINLLKISELIVNGDRIKI